jgi:beta-lactam-binding protein with PASTA domain
MAGYLLNQILPVFNTLGNTLLLRGIMFDKLKKSFWFHLVLVLAICMILYALFFVGLSRITGHGKEVIVPNVTGKDLTEATAILQSMHFNVSVDSTYEPGVKPLMVLKQMPDTGSMVKEGRIVMMTVNRITPPTIPMPNMVGLSYKSAEMLIRNNKLVLGDTTSKSDVSDAILEQLYNGAPIKAGEPLIQGSRISLIIGNGMGNTQHDVPDVTGRSVDAAQTILSQYHLQIELVLKDPTRQIADTSETTVFNQDPAAKDSTGKANRIKDGDKIILTIE